MDKVIFKVDGLDQIISSFGKMAAKIEKEIADEATASAYKIQSDAKKNAPVNFGNLRNSINVSSEYNNNKIVYLIGSNLPYAPYVEFGTGGKVSIPNGYADFAMQFKGKKGGKFVEMVKALALWVAKKGITGTYSVKTQKRTGNKSTRGKQDMSAAYAIAISILRKGLRPQPYLIPAFEAEKPKLRTKIKEIISNAKS
jgi:HK97 gp10 family phage protein